MAREYKDYVAKTKFDITLDETGVETIYKDQELKFNGVQAIIAEEKMKMPKLRAAVRAGWLVEKSELASSSDYRPSSAEIKMSKATPQQEDTFSGGITEISDEEQVVNTVESRDEFLDEGNKRSHRERQVTAEEEVQRASQSVRGGGKGPQDRQPTTPNIISDAGDQEGKDIGVRFKTSTDSTTDLSKMSDQDLQKTVHDLGSKPTRTVEEQEDVVRKNTSPERQQERQSVTGEKRVAEGIAFDNHNVGDRSSVGVEGGHKAQANTSANPYDDEAQVVSQVNKASSPQQEESVGVSEALEIAEEELDDNLDPSVKEGRYRVAKIIHPSLPDWDFEAHWRHKIQRIKDEFSDDELVLRALYASESEAIKKRIKEEFGIRLSL